MEVSPKIDEDISSAIDGKKYRLSSGDLTTIAPVQRFITVRDTALSDSSMSCSPSVRHLPNRGYRERPGAFATVLFATAHSGIKAV